MNTISWIVCPVRMTISAIIIVIGTVFVLAETNASAQPAGELGWKVWVKTSPCSGLFDWVGVAKENPGFGGGGSTWSTADLVVSGGGLSCVSIQSNCTFAAASAEREIVRAAGQAAGQFANYCCREYSVWENVETRKFSIVRGKFGTAGHPWQIVKPDLCCPEAEALAGISGACGDLTQGGNQHGGAAAFIGCFKDPNSPFDLDGALERSQANTPQRCIETCRAKGFAYAGVQYGESCLCGNTYGKFGPADNCTMQCTGDASQICGGINSNSVYSTGTITGGIANKSGKSKCPGTVRYANGIDPTCPQ